MPSDKKTLRISIAPEYVVGGLNVAAGDKHRFLDKPKVMIKRGRGKNSPSSQKPDS